MPFDMQEMLGKLTNSIPALQEENAQARADAMAIQRGLIHAVQELTSVLHTDIQLLAQSVQRLEAVMQRAKDAI